MVDVLHAFHFPRWERWEEAARAAGPAPAERGVAVVRGATAEGTMRARCPALPPTP
jgi:hypothetical protein